MPRLLAARLAKARDAGFSVARSGAGGAARAATPLSVGASWRKPDNSWPHSGPIEPPTSSRSRSCTATARDLLREREVGLRQSRVDGRAHERLLERVAVVDHLDLCLLDARGDLGDDVRRG